MELATATERREMIALRENTIRFFKQMEDNIRSKIGIKEVVLSSYIYILLI